MDALRCPPARRRCRCSPAASAAGWPCAACCSPSRTSCCWTSPPTTWTPNRSPGWSTTCSSIKARSSPSPTTAISWTTSPAGSWSWTAATASPGRAIIPPGWSRSRSACAARRTRESKRQKTLERELEWIHMSPKARQAKGKARVTAYEKLLSQEIRAAPRRPGDLHPARPAPGGYRHRAGKGLQRLRRAAADRQPDREHPARAASSGVIGPNGAGKTTLLRLITGQEEARRRRDPHRARRSSWPTSTRAARPSTARKTVWEEISGGEDTIELGERPRELTRLRRQLQLPRRRPAEEGRGPLRRRAQPRPPGQDAHARRQRAPAGRADQRPGRQHPARPGRGAGQLRRLRDRRLATTAGSWTGSPPTSWPSKATARCAGSMAIIPTTMLTGARGASEKKFRSASATAISRETDKIRTCPKIRGVPILRFVRLRRTNLKIGSPIHFRIDTQFI